MYGGALARLAAETQSRPGSWNRLAEIARTIPARVRDSDFAAGATALPYRLAGAPVDMLDMVARPFLEPAFRAAGSQLPPVEQMVGSSDWMVQKAANAGMLRPRTNRVGELAGDILGQIAAPGGGAGEAAAMKAIFAGPLAMTADLPAMARAEARLASGDAPETVWSDEGWFRGPDGKMRFEIDDRGAMTVRPQDYADDPSVPIDSLGRPSPNKLGQIMVHEDLESAYPEIQNIGVNLIDDNMQGQLGGFWGGVQGGYVPSTDEIYLAPGLWSGDAAKSTQIHELQHAIQRREGFATGGGTTNPQDIAAAKAAGLSPAQYYRRLAGEAEARAVQARIPLSAADRRARYPLQDYDVPLDELIVRR